MAAGAGGEARGAVHGAGCAQGVDPELGLAPQRGVEGEIPLRVDRRAVVAQAHLRQGGELGRQRDRGVARGARRHDARRQAETQRLVGAAPRAR